MYLRALHVLQSAAYLRYASVLEQHLLPVDIVTLVVLFIVLWFIWFVVYLFSFLVCFLTPARRGEPTPPPPPLTYPRRRLPGSTRHAHAHQSGFYRCTLHLVDEYYPVRTRWWRAPHHRVHHVALAGLFRGCFLLADPVGTRTLMRCQMISLNFRFSLHAHLIYLNVGLYGSFRFCVGCLNACGYLPFYDLDRGGCGL